MTLNNLEMNAVSCVHHLEALHLKTEAIGGEFSRSRTANKVVKFG